VLADAGGIPAVSGVDEPQMATSQVALRLLLATAARRFNYGRSAVAVAVILSFQTAMTFYWTCNYCVVFFLARWPTHIFYNYMKNEDPQTRCDFPEHPECPDATLMMHVPQRLRGLRPLDLWRHDEVGSASNYKIEAQEAFSLTTVY